ncbi:MAG: hypothetical protein ABI268_07790 [Rhodanobacter sp.]
MRNAQRSGSMVRINKATRGNGTWEAETPAAAAAQIWSTFPSFSLNSFELFASKDQKAWPNLHCLTHCFSTIQTPDDAILAGGLTGGLEGRP